MLLLVSGIIFANVKVVMDFDTMLGFHIMSLGATLIVSEIIYFDEFFQEYSYLFYNIFVAVALIQGIVFFIKTGIIYSKELKKQQLPLK